MNVLGQMRSLTDADKIKPMFRFKKTPKPPKPNKHTKIPQQTNKQNPTKI